MPLRVLLWLCRTNPLNEISGNLSDFKNPQPYNIRPLRIVNEYQICSNCSVKYFLSNALLTFSLHVITIFH